MKDAETRKFMAKMLGPRAPTPTFGLIYEELERKRMKRDDVLAIYKAIGIVLLCMFFTYVAVETLKNIISPVMFAVGICGMTSLAYAYVEPVIRQLQNRKR